MTYSYYSNYGSNNQNKYNYSGFGNNTQKQQESSGGWSKGAAKGLDTLQSGGWGKKTQPTGVFSGSTFGTGNAFGANKTTFGKTTFGSGGSTFSSKGFGTSFGTSKLTAKRNPVPISTLGLNFTSMKKEERINNQRKEYTVFHINMIEMFSQYTSDELRIYDYVSTDLIRPIDDTTQSTIQNKTTGFQLSSSTSTKKEEKVVNHNVQWYQVPLKDWPEVKGPEKGTENKKPYWDLPAPKFEVADDKKKEEVELPPNTRVKLKGFKTSNTTFQNHLNNLSSEQDITLIDPSFKEEDFKFRLQFSLTPTTQRASTLQGLNARRATSGPSTTRFSSRTHTEMADQEAEESDMNGLSFIPNIKNKTTVSNLNISKEGVKIIFPFEVDVTKLNPKNNVKIEDETKTQIDKKRDKRGREINIVSTISVIKISIDTKDNIDISTPSIIFYNIEDSNHFYVKTAKKPNATEHVGSIVNEYIPSLECYPVEIYYEKKREQVDPNKK